MGQISAWLRPDSLDADIRRHSQAELLRELDWAAHQSLQAVVVPLPDGSPANYARTLLQVSSSGKPSAIKQPSCVAASTYSMPATCPLSSEPGKAT